MPILPFDWFEPQSLTTLPDTVQFSVMGNLFYFDVNLIYLLSSSTFDKVKTINRTTMGILLLIEIW